jgi:hypothetical protein
LEIYEDEFDPHAKVESLDVLLDPILQTLMSNQVVPVGEDSTLIANLKDYVFPYYKDLFDLVIPQMKVVLDNYSRYIINQYRYIQIAEAIFDKASQEKIVQ